MLTADGIAVRGCLYSCLAPSVACTADPTVAMMQQRMLDHGISASAKQVQRSAGGTLLIGEVAYSADAGGAFRHRRVYDATEALLVFRDLVRAAIWECVNR